MRAAQLSSATSPGYSDRMGALTPHVRPNPKLNPTWMPPGMSPAPKGKAEGAAEANQGCKVALQNER